MKNKVVIALFIFSLGYMFNNIVGNIVNEAQASYCNCSESDFSFSSFDIYDFESRVESIVEDSISQYNYNFESEVEDIVEDCYVDGNYINC